MVQIMSAKGNDAQKTTLGRVLRLLRNAEGISAAELATRLGWSPSYISAIETGKKEPTLRILNDYGQYFGISPATLLYILEENLYASNAE
ncbi:MAG: helix-turn-helix domain-containing protein, partial [Coriobacteriaceae bacterium]|nr:helix-turn-helix domain-containing protein [Coriobacteriaceae bacterium]